MTYTELEIITTRHMDKMAFNSGRGGYTLRAALSITSLTGELFNLKKELLENNRSLDTYDICIPEVFTDILI